MKSCFVLVGLSVLALLGACSTNTNMDATTRLDPYQKTIIISSDSGKLTADVGEMFKQNSWQVGDAQSLPNARYSLVLSYNETQRCMPRLDEMYHYDLSITDNQHGNRVFNMHGDDCQHTILGHLDDYLKNKKL